MPQLALKNKSEGETFYNLDSHLFPKMELTGFSAAPKKDDLDQQVDYDKTILFFGGLAKKYKTSELVRSLKVLDPTITHAAVKHLRDFGYAFAIFSKDMAEELLQKKYVYVGKRVIGVKIAFDQTIFKRKRRQRNNKNRNRRRASSAEASLSPRDIAEVVVDEAVRAGVSNAFDDAHSKNTSTTRASET